MHVLAYSREMDQLVLTNNITPSKVRELSSPTCIEYGNTNMKDKKETMPPSTPRSEMPSNDMDQTPTKPSFV